MVNENYVILICLVFSAIAEAQYNPEETLIEEYLELDDLAAGSVAELFDYYTLNPLQWAECRAADIEALPLNEDILATLVDLKRRDVILKRASDLGKFSDLSRQEQAVVARFIRFGSSVSLEGQLKSYTAMVFKRGKGDVSKSSCRIQSEFPSGWIVGGVAERDLGEARVWDHYNWGIRIPKLWDRVDLMAGSFRLHWGHGLLFSTGMIGGKFGNVMQGVAPKSLRASNYIGADENRFLKGLVSRVRLESAEILSFYSRREWDATISEGVAHSLRTDGYHVSPAQLASRKALREILYGTGIQYQHRHHLFGVLLYTSNYPVPLVPIGTRRQLMSISCRYQQHYGMLQLAGELIYQDTDRLGAIQTVKLVLDDFQSGLQIRYLSEGIFAPMGNPLKAYSGMPGNEKGIYWAMRFPVMQKIRLSMYMDCYRRIQSGAAGETPPAGIDVSIRIKWRLQGKNILNLGFKRTKHYQAIGVRGNSRKQQISLNLRYFTTDRLAMSIRLKRVYYFDDLNRSSTGTGLNNTIHWYLNQRDRVSFGTAQFYTSSYDARVYLYETGIPLRFNVTMMQGTGQRYFVFFRKYFQEQYGVAVAYKWQRSRKNGSDPYQTNSTLEFQMLVDL